MARVQAPFFGLGASGTIGKAFTLGTWKGRPYVRKHVIPANPKSALQTAMRAVLKFVTQDWQNLSAAIQDNWNDLAAADNITALNAHVRDAGDRARRNLGVRQDPEATAGTTPDAPTGLAVTSQPGALVLSWTRPAANKGDYATRVHLATATMTSPSIANLVLMVPVATVSTTITGLTAGTTYYFRCAETNGDGEIGAFGTEASGAPT